MKPFEQIVTITPFRRKGFAARGHARRRDATPFLERGSSCPQGQGGGIPPLTPHPSPLTPHGFTLIELLVVVMIIGILATIVVINVADRPDEARVAKTKADVSTLVTALKLYKLDNYVYPTTAQGLEALVNKPAGQPEPANYKQDGYIEVLPEDPWGKPYQYLQPGAHGEVDVYSLGADGALGGQGINADIGNWNLSEG